MSSTKLLQNQIEKFGVVTVMDVLFLDTADNKPILYLDTLKMTSINQEGETKEIRGGIGAPELISYDFARTISLEIQDALASMSSLELLWGGKAIDTGFDYTSIFEAKLSVEGEVVTVEMPTGVTLTKDTEELAEAYKQALVLSPGANLGKGATYTVVSAEGQTLTLGGTAVAKARDNEVVKVFIPAKMAEGVDGAVALAINSIDLPPTVKMVGQTFFIEQATGKQLPMQIEVPLLKINIGGGMTMEAEGDAAVFDFNAKALADPITKNFFVLKQLGKAE